MKFGIVVFPGSNCDEDAFHAAKDVFGQEAEYLWHKDTDLKGADVVILPGGFAHGDYLRTGAMARFSPIMARGAGVRRARRPGARHLQRFPDSARGRAAAGRDAAQPRPEVSAASTSTCASSRPTRRSPRAPRVGQVLRIPIATARATTSRRRTCSQQLEANRQVIFRYTDPRRATSTTACESERIGRTRSPASATSGATSSA